MTRSLLWVALACAACDAGHDPSFGRDRLVEPVDAYLRKRDPGYGATAAA